MIFYDFYYGILVERIFLWFLWFFTCQICGNGFCSFLFQSLMVFMVFMIFMILNFLFMSGSIICEFVRVCESGMLKGSWNYTELEASNMCVDKSGYIQQEQTLYLLALDSVWCSPQYPLVIVDKVSWRWRCWTRLPAPGMPQSCSRCSHVHNLDTAGKTENI